jgi:hypothetical protein
MEYITLIGSEDVKSASYKMQSATEDFGRHVQQLDHILTVFTQNMTELVERLEELKKEK